VPPNKTVASPLPKEKPVLEATLPTTGAPKEKTPLEIAPPALAAELLNVNGDTAAIDSTAGSAGSDA
jgi:hypothetical protein